MGSLLLLVGTSFVVTARIRKRADLLGPPGRFAGLTARGLDGAMIGFLVSGSFVTVLFYPYLWFAIGLTAALEQMVRNIQPEGAPVTDGKAAAAGPTTRWRPGVHRGPVVVPAAPSQMVRNREATQEGILGVK